MGRGVGARAWLLLLCVLILLAAGAGGGIFTAEMAEPSDTSVLAYTPGPSPSSLTAARQEATPNATAASFAHIGKAYRATVSMAMLPTSTDILPAPIPAVVRKVEELTVTILYDNITHDARLETAWGFACLIEAGGKQILFDTGGDSRVLLANMARLGFRARDIDMVILSHIHSDHVGGLGGLLERNSGLTIYVPHSFPDDFKGRLRQQGYLREVSGTEELFPGIYTTGEMGNEVVEQALVIETGRGLVVVTGCAHPGIVEVVAQARRVRAGGVYLALGGFHLGGKTAQEIGEIIAGLRRLGVEKVAPSHCTGELAQKLMGAEFGENYIINGTGKTIVIESVPCKDGSFLFERGSFEGIYGFWARQGFIR